MLDCTGKGGNHWKKLILEICILMNTRDYWLNNDIIITWLNTAYIKQLTKRRPTYMQRPSVFLLCPLIHNYNSSL